MFLYSSGLVENRRYSTIYMEDRIEISSDNIFLSRFGSHRNSNCLDFLRLYSTSHTILFNAMRWFTMYTLACFSTIGYLARNNSRYSSAWFFAFMDRERNGEVMFIPWFRFDSFSPLIPRFMFWDIEEIWSRKSFDFTTLLIA